MKDALDHLDVLAVIGGLLIVAICVGPIKQINSTSADNAGSDSTTVEVVKDVHNRMNKTIGILNDLKKPALDHTYGSNAAMWSPAEDDRHNSVVFFGKDAGIDPSNYDFNQ